MCIVRSRDSPRLGVLADHVVGLPPCDVHEVGAVALAAGSPQFTIAV